MFLSSVGTSGYIILQHIAVIDTFNLAPDFVIIVVHETFFIFTTCDNFCDKDKGLSSRSLNEIKVSKIV